MRVRAGFQLRNAVAVAAGSAESGVYQLSGEAVAAVFGSYFEITDVDPIFRGGQLDGTDGLSRTLRRNLNIPSRAGGARGAHRIVNCQAGLHIHDTARGRQGAGARGG